MLKSTLGEHPETSPRDLAAQPCRERERACLRPLRAMDTGASSQRLGRKPGTHLSLVSKMLRGARPRWELTAEVGGQSKGQKETLTPKGCRGRVVAEGTAVTLSRASTLAGEAGEPEAASGLATRY